MVDLAGVPFLELGHHDGRFIRGPGLFAFSRRGEGAEREILHFELAEDISRTARPWHAAWPAALGAGMNELLVHLAGCEAQAVELDPALLASLAAELAMERPPERRAG